MGASCQRTSAWLSILSGLVFRTLLLTSLTLACGSVVAQDRTFDFALIGDMPYTKVQEREYQRVLEALNAADLAFVAHIGDFQFDARPYNQNPAIASMPCVDDNYKAILSSFQSVRHPFILPPGDNDWTDCWPLQAQKVDPLELLAKVYVLSRGTQPWAEVDRGEKSVCRSAVRKIPRKSPLEHEQRDIRHRPHRRQQ